MSTLNKNTLVVFEEQKKFKACWRDTGMPFMQWRSIQEIDRDMPLLEQAGIQVIRADQGESINAANPEELAAAALACALEMLAASTKLPYEAVKQTVIGMAKAATTQDRDASRGLAEEIYRDLKEVCN